MEMSEDFFTNFLLGPKNVLIQEYYFNVDLLKAIQQMDEDNNLVSSVIN